MTSLSAKSQGILLEVAARVVPAAANLDESGREEFFAVIDAALMDRTAAMRRQLALFLRILALGPVLRYGRTFAALPPNRQDDVLRWFQDAPVTRVRQGFWGLKTLVFMGYYGRVASWEEIGYAPRIQRGAHA